MGATTTLPTTTATILPDWVLWVQALGPTTASVMTALIAIAVGMVAFNQWRTAKHKLVLDLFDKRYALYERAKKGVDEATRDGDVRNNDAIRHVASVRGEADFLFGKDVCDYFAKLQKDMAALGLARDMIPTDNTTADWPQLSLDSSKAIYAFYEEFPKLAAPYMKMHHKL